MGRIQILFFVSFYFLVSACTTHKGIALQPQCAGNCQYVGMAYGSSSINKVLGMGGNKMNAMLFEARRNLVRAFPLSKNSFYDNIVIDEKYTHYLFFSKQSVTITADIVVTGMLAEDKTYSDNYLNSIAGNYAHLNEYIHLSDSVVYVVSGKLVKGIVIGFTNHKAKVLVTNGNGFLNEQTVAAELLFCIDNEELEELTGLEAGQVISISGNSVAKNGLSIQEVAGLRSNKVLIANKQGNSVKYSIMPVKPNTITP